MGRSRMAFLAFCLFFLSWMSACRMTETQMRSISPDLLRQATQADYTTRTQVSGSTRTGSKIQWFLTTAVLLAGGIIFFASSDRSPKRKRTSVRRRPVTRRRKR